MTAGMETKFRMCIESRSIDLRAAFVESLPLVIEAFRSLFRPYERQAGISVQNPPAHGTRSGLDIGIRSQHALRRIRHLGWEGYRRTYKHIVNGVRSESRADRPEDGFVHLCLLFACH